MRVAPLRCVGRCGRRAQAGLNARELETDEARPCEGGTDQLIETASQVDVGGLQITFRCGGGVALGAQATRRILLRCFSPRRFTVERNSLRAGLVKRSRWRMHPKKMSKLLRVGETPVRIDHHLQGLVLGLLMGPHVALLKMGHHQQGFDKVQSAAVENGRR